MRAAVDISAIVTRKEAVAKGLKYYFTGTPCVHGHVAQKFCPSGGCVECRKIRNAKDHSKEWFRNNHLKNRDKRLGQMKAYASQNRHVRKQQRLAREYNLTVAEYEAMASAQNNCCAICKTSSDRPLYVDHCHTSKQVRGLLCLTCNFMLGYAYDDPNILTAGIEYLRLRSAEL